MKTLLAIAAIMTSTMAIAQSDESTFEQVGDWKVYTEDDGSVIAASVFSDHHEVNVSDIEFMLALTCDDEMKLSLVVGKELESDSPIMLEIFDREFGGARVGLLAGKAGTMISEVKDWDSDTGHFDGSLISHRSPNQIVGKLIDLRSVDVVLLVYGEERRFVPAFSIDGIEEVYHAVASSCNTAPQERQE